MIYFQSCFSDFFENTHTHMHSHPHRQQCTRLFKYICVSIFRICPSVWLFIIQMFLHFVNVEHFSDKQQRLTSFHLCWRYFCMSIRPSVHPPVSFQIFFLDIFYLHFTFHKYFPPNPKKKLSETEIEKICVIWRPKQKFTKNTNERILRHHFRRRERNAKKKQTMN